MSPACRGPMVAKPPVEHRANVSRTMPRARGNDDTRHIETPRTETPHTDERRSHTPRIEAPRDKTPRSSVELRPGTWTRLMVAVMRLAGGPDLGILLGSGP